MEGLWTKATILANTVHNELERCPEGRVISAIINGKPGYIRITYEGGKRVRKVITSDSALVRALLRRELLTNEQDLLARSLKALARALEEMPGDDRGQILRRMMDKHPQLEFEEVRALMDGGAEDGDWARQPYEQLGSYPEGKTQITSRGLRVRSKSELMIAEALYDAGIRFRYEQILHIGDAGYAPDFTIKRHDGKLMYWEHCGRMADRRYFDRHFNKLRSYFSAGIVPWDDLIITYDSLEGSVDMRDVRSVIERRLLVF
jgi:hypothetical protein